MTFFYQNLYSIIQSNIRDGALPFEVINYRLNLNLTKVFRQTKDGHMEKDQPPPHATPNKEIRDKRGNGFLWQAKAEGCMRRRLEKDIINQIMVPEFPRGNANQMLFNSVYCSVLITIGLPYPIPDLSLKINTLSQTKIESS